jgi:hypothetical protein
MARESTLVSETRKYLVTTVAQARNITEAWLNEIGLSKATKLGLPEVDDRYRIWRVPICNKRNVKVGEVVIDAYTTGILYEKTTRPEMLEARLLQKENGPANRRRQAVPDYKLSPLRNTVGLGDCIGLMDEMPAESVDLIFTSPPYFNARPEYSEYEDEDLTLEEE